MTTHNNMRIAAIIWLGIVILLGLTAWHKHPSIDTSMMHLLPQSQQAPLVSEVSKQIGRKFSQRVLLVISGDNPTAIPPAVEMVATQFSQLPAVASATWRIRPQDIAEANAALQPYRYTLLTDQLHSKLASGDTRFVRQQAVSQLLNPVSVGQADLVNDPFFLLTQWQLSQAPEYAIHIEDNLLKLNSDTENSYLVLLTLSEDAFKRETQKTVLAQLNQLKETLSPKGISIIASGLIVHADAGTTQAEQEISTIGVGSLIGIVMIFFWVFGSLRQIPLLFVPIIIGCIVASASLFIIFDHVHIITFSFGAGLIGISIDYALHFICERQLTTNVIKRLLPGLLLGLCTSVAAFSAQAITPFPGLRQMALFSIFGLIGAWLTVVLWMPFMTKNMQTKRVPAFQYINQLLNLTPSIDSHKVVMPVLALLAVTATMLIASGNTVDDIRLLQTSPPALIARDAHIHKQLQLNNASQFLLLPCKKLQNCLETEEEIKPHLSALVEEGVLSQYSLVSNQLPSIRKQSQNAELTKALFVNELEALFDTIQVPNTLREQAQQSFNQAISRRLSIEYLPETLQTESLKAKIIQTQSYGAATVINIKSSPSEPLKTKLEDLFNRFPNLLLVDQVDTISSLMKSYRLQVMQWCGLAYMGIFLFFLMRYKSQALRMITPPLLASLITAAIIMHTMGGINLFHMLALMLVLGIGMDMGIFLIETHHAPQTWLAVTLSILTSLLAFGLLFLSKTPVLSHFGITLLLGLTLVWILSILVRPTKK